MVICCVGGAVGLASAQVGELSNSGSNPLAGPRERSVSQWLMRLQQGSRVPSYVGAFVVSSANGAMSSARIWHVRQGNVQWERVETLSGVPRATFRHNNRVMTFLPQSRTVRTELFDAGRGSPNLFAVGALGLTADFYSARQIGQDRVAGVEADIVQLTPRDSLRFGYRIWSEQRTGLVVKTETLDDSGRVLVQAAFSELQFNAPVQAAVLRRMMDRTQGYKVEQSEHVLTSASAQDWSLKSPVPGFQPQGCFRRAGKMAPPLVQWIFSDGLATVSLFIEPYDALRDRHEGAAVVGATHTLARRLTLAGADWWVTAVGEVPTSTLGVFIDRLQRR